MPSESFLSRRAFLRASLLTAGALALDHAVPLPVQAAPMPLSAQQPNLLIIHTDQQNCWTLGAYGGTLVETPNIDRIGREGATLNNFFTNSPVCTPSRGCLLTGRYPHQHGAHKNNQSILRTQITLADVLHQAGYRTGYAGKWHLWGDRKPGWVPPRRNMGFIDNRYMFNRGHWKSVIDEGEDETSPQLSFDVGEGTYMSDWLTDKAIAFMKRRKRPFFFMVSYPDPHPAYMARPPYDTFFDPAEMPVPATFSEDGLPDWARQARQDGPYALDNQNREATMRQNRAHYCGAVKLLDQCVGRILAELEQNNLLDNTIIVFTSDHGDYLGEHGLQGKNLLYETACRVPLLVRWPAAISTGLRLNEMFSTVDVMPTILGLMGIAPAGTEAGRDGSALLRGNEIPWNNEVFVHHDSLEMAALYTPDFCLGHALHTDSILFDQIHDPLQANNLFNDPRYQGIITHLTRRLAHHHQAIASPFAEWLSMTVPRRPIYSYPGRIPL